ncbi:MAG: calcineurin-like phosphoesterase C-terminal domain-containing protein [Xanthomonadales bacterium]|nr:calcineurin-like phosphoesterase C-terminal domain-containing protein [Xanthomonadales bacterium]
MVKTLLLAFALLAGPDRALEGVVFLDRDGDGRQDPGEPGLEGIPLSDGIGIVLSGAEGRFRIASATGRVLLLKPAGHRPPPRPDGLPRLWLEAGDEPLSFPLLPIGEEPERLLLLADPQVGTAEEVGHVDRSLRHRLAGEAPVCATLLLGDLVNDRPELYAKLIAALAAPERLLLALPGNHDLEPAAAATPDPWASFRARFGAVRYGLRCGRLRVLLLPGVVPLGPGRWRPGFDADDLRFAAAFAALGPAGDPVVIATHVPIAEEERMPEAETRALLEPFAGAPLALVAGHWHRQELRLDLPGVRLFWVVGAVSGSWWSGPPDAAGVPESPMSDGTPRGYGLLAWDGSRFRPAYRPARGGEPLHLHLPRVLAQGSYPSAMLWANLHLGHAGSQLRFRVGEGPWQPMERVAAPDPTLFPLLVAQDRAERLPAWSRVPDPRPSTHLWRARLPTGLAVGEHRIEVEAEDGFGNRHRAVASYRLERRP